MTKVAANKNHVLHVPFRYADANTKQPANITLKNDPSSALKIIMAANGPLPTTLIFLNDLHSLPKAAKVRFLGWYAFFSLSP